MLHTSFQLSSHGLNEYGYFSCHFDLQLSKSVYACFSVFPMYGHTLHPTINEYTDIDDFDEAHRRVISQEMEAVDTLRQTFSIDKAYTACHPGNQKSYLAMLDEHKNYFQIFSKSLLDLVYKLC